MIWSGRGGPPAAPNADAGSGTPSRRGVRTLPAPAPAGDEEWHPPHHWWCHIVWPDWPIAPPLPFTRNRNAFISTRACGAGAGHRLWALRVPRTRVPHSPARSPRRRPPRIRPLHRPPPPGSPSRGLQRSPIRTRDAGGPAGSSRRTAAGCPAAGNRCRRRIRHEPDFPAFRRQTWARSQRWPCPAWAGIAALTALGGFVGYRQAKAGYVLRAAGTARFLQ